MKKVRNPDSIRRPELQRSPRITVGEMPRRRARLSGSVISRVPICASPSDESTLAGSRMASTVAPA